MRGGAISAGDATAATESELQAVIVGDKSAVDLARTIEQSNYYANYIFLSGGRNRLWRSLPSKDIHNDQRSLLISASRWALISS